MIFGIGKKKGKERKAIKAPTRSTKGRKGLFAPFSKFFLISSVNIVLHKKKLSA